MNLSRTQTQTEQLKLLKIGALISVTARKIWISMASGYHDTELLEAVCLNHVELRC
jgi:hypothetical protein